LKNSRKQRAKKSKSGKEKSGGEGEGHSSDVSKSGEDSDSAYSSDDKQARGNKLKSKLSNEGNKGAGTVEVTVDESDKSSDSVSDSDADTDDTGKAINRRDKETKPLIEDSEEIKLVCIVKL
jgi:hypothetical protein